MAMTDDVRARLEAAMAGSPFIRFTGMRITSVDADAGTLEMTMPPRAELMRGDEADGMLHGGPVAALIDTAGDFVIALAVGGVVPTIGFRVDYFRPTRGELRAVAIARRIGRAICTADVDVFGSDGKLCAVGRGTYSGRTG